LYDLLEHQIIPAFYERNENGIPTRWVAHVRQSMARLTPQFSANRAVREYLEKYYLPAAKTYRAREANKGALADKIVDWQRVLREHWQSIAFGPVEVNSDSAGHEFTAEVCFHEALLHSITVELYADAATGGQPEQIQMQRRMRLKRAQNGYIFSARVSSDRPASDYTPRVIPWHPDANVPLETSEILWRHG